uniref:Uncharacterized protein n=1 Tax=Panagrolaimus sp. ES5 TaxID=591445 RepID=A0AC34FGU0_9BILA
MKWRRETKNPEERDEESAKNKT